NLAKAIEGLEVIRSCFRGEAPRTGFQACATFGRFRAFGKTLAEITVYIGVETNEGFVAARGKLPAATCC
ncbi:hypothetical protein, partial [Mesorhizobium sp.]|uniref:hypothetical protein n=1 Tax=Mesorhizobium sp. TaxID=1871066 RepID=UPI0025C17CAB